MNERLRPHVAPVSALMALGLAFWVLYERRPAARPPEPPPVVDSGGLAVAFTRPAAAEAQALSGGPEAGVVRAIDGAAERIDVAMYDLNLWDVRDALLRARARGVEVRLVMEHDNMGAAEVTDLQSAGIPVVGDTDEGLMHDKFVVIDGREVWTGSMNLTVSDAHFNRNNLLRLPGADVARVYSAEFDEMFTGRRFGPLSPRGTGFRTPDGVTEVYFAPDDGAAARLIEILSQARSTVDLMAFAFTSEPVAQALLERAQAGVRVRLVFDAEQAANLGSQYRPLLSAGLEARLDGSPDKMHHKVVIVDGATVVTGSYNFSRSAEESNDENLVIVHDAGLAQQYEEEFESVFAGGR
jgi:phosphatidylserine/phosphatidylglycerophosphate/cardiolipin synthase-like enzyme